MAKKKQKKSTMQRITIIGTLMALSVLLLGVFMQLFSVLRFFG
ncbi:DUF4044 domain-containing protein [Carnobacteriaceae bacterium zg-ZUI252]|nr:DUF4044 domain-containing protein [Carnobacteriaceae bacterium zg-ZUI252]MBS4769838.1 DUF4044 domain-containing protein [Carnobacteriaceae bacterium zg-ZUI240]QTU82647.1 DUF4044 domain-containing protein [Carnobacteriaceae bacterium zg-C25]